MDGYLDPQGGVPVDLVTDVAVTGYDQQDGQASAIHAGGRESAAVVVAADGIRSVARPLLSDGEPASSSYVAYRSAVSASQVEALGVSMRDVVDELDHAFADTCEKVRAGLPLRWLDRWWRMFDREPIPTWVTGRIALSGDSAHAPLQYLAQGAVMAIEDAYVLAEHVGSQLAGGAEADTLDCDAALAA